MLLTARNHLWKYLLKAKRQRKNNIVDIKKPERNRAFFVFYLQYPQSLFVPVAE